MTDDELKQLVASLSVNHQKMAEEAVLARKENDKAMKELRQQIGGIANLLAVLPRDWLCLR
jgi:hypothetical protein